MQVVTMVPAQCGRFQSVILLTDWFWPLSGPSPEKEMLK